MRIGPYYNDFLRLLFPPLLILGMGGCSEREEYNKTDIKKMRIELTDKGVERYGIKLDELKEANGWKILSKVLLGDEKYHDVLWKLNGRLGAPYAKKEFLAPTAVFVIPLIEERIETPAEKCEPIVIYQPAPITMTCPDAGEEKNIPKRGTKKEHLSSRLSKSQEEQKAAAKKRMNVLLKSINKAR